jgi:hypothetical protein
MTNLAVLKQIAREFRNKFESTDLSGAPGFLASFPDGCCSWPSYMIGHFLKYEMGIDPVEIQAERLTPDSTVPHSWLMVGDVIIDITSNVFEDSKEKVIVSSKSTWHDSWDIKHKTEVSRIETFDKIDFGDKLKPSQVYELLVKDIRGIAHNKSRHSDA